jgi:hypothetical protein
MLGVPRRSPSSPSRPSSLTRVVLVVRLISFVDRRPRACSVENAEVGLEHDQRGVDSCIAWLSERLAFGPTLTAQIRPDQQRRRASPAWLLTQGGCCTNKRRWHSRTTPRIGDATGALLRAAGAYTRLICCPGRDRNWTPITTAFRCGGFVQQPRRRSGSHPAPAARSAVDCWMAPIPHVHAANRVAALRLEWQPSRRRCRDRFVRAAVRPSVGARVPAGLSRLRCSACALGRIGGTFRPARVSSASVLARVSGSSLAKVAGRASMGTAGQPKYPASVRPLSAGPCRNELVWRPPLSGVRAAAVSRRRWSRCSAGCGDLWLEHDPRGDSAGFDVGYGFVDLVERSGFADHACLAGCVKLEHLA